MQRTDSLEKTLMLGKIEGGRRKGMTEDEMVGWHHRLDGQEFEWTPGAGDGQGGLACYSPWGRRELDTTERLNWTESGMRWRNHHFRGRKLSSRENKYFSKIRKVRRRKIRDCQTKDLFLFCGSTIQNGEPWMAFSKVAPAQSSAQLSLLHGKEISFKVWEGQSWGSSLQ